MIGKKINQLATELAPVSTDLTIIGDPISGVSKKITLSQLGAIFSGAVSFYDNFASFPVTGDINVIYCAKDTQKLYLWSASAYVEVFPSQALLDGFVPYTGATGDVDLGSYKLSLNKEQFDSISAPTYSEGLVWYDSAQKSLAFYNDSSLSPVFIGENIVLKVYNNTGSTISKGAAVYIQSGGSFTYPNVALAKADNASTSAVIGLMNANTPTGSFGYVTSTGVITGVNTGSFTEGTILYLSPYSAGQLMNTIPPTGYVIQVGVVAHSNSPNGTIYTKQTTPLAISASTIVGTLAISQGGTGATTAPTALSNLGGIGLTSLSASSPLSYNNTTGAFSISQANTSTNGFLSSTDWNTFNSKQGYLTNPITGTGVSGQVTYFNGTTSVTGNNNFFWDAANNRLGIGTTTPQRSIEIFNSTADNHLRLSGAAPSVSMGEAVTGSIYQAKFALITANGQFVTAGVAGDFIILSQTGATIFATNSTEKMRVSASGNLSVGNTNNTYKLDVSGTGRFTGQLRLESTITDGTNTYTLPSATGTLALTSQLTGGTVTSVGLSSATSGVTIGSTPITTSGTITLAIATASGSQQGLLSSTDWTTFNNKQNALTNPVTGSGTTNYLPKFTGASTIGNSLLIDQANYIESTANMLISNATTYRGLSITTTTASARPTLSFVNSNYVQYGSYIQDINGRLAFGRMNYDFGGHSESMTLNASGNLGLGVTPSAWGAGQRAFQFGSIGSIETDGDAVAISNNRYYDGGANRYTTSDFSSIYSQVNGSHVWYSAPSGTAGNAISFTQAMTLNASGNLSIGNTNDTFKLDVTGTGRFTGNLTTNGIFIGRTTNGQAFGVGNGVDSDMGIFVQTNNIAFSNSGTNSGVSFALGGSTRFSIASTGAATFSSSVTATDGFQGKYFRIFEASAQRGGFYSYNVISGSGTDYSLGLFSESSLWFAAGGGVTKNLIITSGGNVLIGSTTGAAKFGVYGANPANTYMLIDNAGSGINYYAANNFHEWQTAGSTKMVLTSSGNVGIGTTSPTEKLDIDGSLNLRGGQIFSAADGSNTMFLNAVQHIFRAGSQGSFAEKMRIKSSGVINFSNVPTSSAGLSSGDIYKSAGVLMIV